MSERMVVPCAIQIEADSLIIKNCNGSIFSSTSE